MSRRCLPLLAMTLLAIGCARGPRPVAERVLAPALTRIELELAAGASTRLRAEPLEANVRPVLHAWDASTGREIARAASGWFGRDVSLSLRNGSASTRRYQLLVCARSLEESGPVALYRDGRVSEARAHAGGQVLRLPVAGVTAYQAAAAPGGVQRALLLGLGRDGVLSGLDESSGPTGLPRLGARAEIAEVLVASLEGPGHISVYANDGTDRDGDGVGRLLERALGTCDSPRDRACRGSALAGYYNAVERATQDSDRDGLPDAAELFGLDALALDLPRYGANPRHKDVLVEVDHHARLNDVGFSEAELAQVAELFARGSASDLRNPDGRAGVNVHFDAGFAPTDPKHLGLLGDFGGSGASQAAEYRAARRADFTPARVGYFRYAFATRSGRGQATGDALTVNRDLQRVSIFAHELGHTLGLSHHGHDSWGDANCKPAYYSIMNYLYQARLELGFSRRAAPWQNPRKVRERAAAVRGMDVLLREAPLELDVRGRGVDWNRDGFISDEPVRAGLTWATFKSCGAAEHGKVSLALDPKLASTPVLVGSAGRLHALWLDAEGKAWIRSENPECETGTDCVGGPWTEPRALSRDALWPPLRTLAAAELTPGRLALAAVDAGGALTLRVADLTAALPPTAASPALPLPASSNGFGVSPLATEMGEGVAISWADVAPQVYGIRRALVLVGRARERGQLVQWVVREDGSGLMQRAVMDTNGRSIVSGGTPSLLELPTGELCAVFPDPERFIRIYVYRPMQDDWLDLTSDAFDAALGPRSTGPVGMAFHRFRGADGTPLGGDASRGALYLSFTEPESAAARNPDNPHYYVSEWLDAQHPARRQLHMRWRGRVITEWTNLAPGTGVALYEDESSDALKALLVEQTRDGGRLELLPHADGTHDADLGSGSDFQVMERGICTVIRGEAACGDASTGTY